MRHIVAGLTVLASVAGACGSAAPDEIAVPTATAVVAREPTVATAAEPTATGPDVLALSSLFDGTPDASGWAVPPGRWSSDAFEEPVVFTTTTELRLVRESDGAVWFRQPEGAAEDFVVVSRSALVNGATVADAQRPPPRTRDAVTAAIEAGTLIELLDMGTESARDGELHWWDVGFPSAADRPGWLCAAGTTCYQPTLTTGGERIVLQADRRSRLFMSDTAVDPPLGAWTSGGDSADVLIDIAQDLLTDAVTAPAAGGADPETRSLTFEGAEEAPIRAGRSVALLADALLTVDTPGLIDGVSLTTADDRSLIFETASGYLAFFSMSGLVPESVDLRPGASHTQTDAELAAPQGRDEFAAFVEAELGIVATGTAELGGTQSTWWDVTIRDPATAYTCPSWPDKRCRALHVGRLGPWAYSGDLENRLYAVGDTSMFLHVEAIDGSITDVLSEGAELLQALTVERIGEP